MPEASRITIDEHFLTSALEDHGHDWHLCLDDGTVHSPAWDDEESKKRTADLRKRPDRHVEILPTDGHKIMRDFVATLTEEPARTRLEDALTMKHSYRRFKDTLLDFPSIRAQWFEFRDRRLRQLALEWLAENEIDAELK